MIKFENIDDVYDLVTMKKYQRCMKEIFSAPERSWIELAGVLDRSHVDFQMRNDIFVSWSKLPQKDSFVHLVTFFDQTAMDVGTALFNRASLK